MSTRVQKISLAAVALVALATIALPTISYAKEDSTVIAIVNGDKIVKGDVLKVLKGMSVPEADTEKVFPVVVNQIINEKLIDKETAKAAIEKDPTFIARLAATKEQMIKTIYLERYLKDKVTESDIKSEYDKFKKANKGKEEVHARHILLKTEEEAKQAIKDLDGGAKFETLANERSDGPAAKNGGDLGYFAQGEVIPEFSNAAFQLKPGTYTKTPVKTPFGWHVVYVEDKRIRVIPELKDVENTIRGKLGQVAIENLVTDLRAKADIKQFDINGKPLENVTKKN